MGDCTWRPATAVAPTRAISIQPATDRPYRYRPRGHAGCTTEEIKGFLRSARGTMCAENFRVGFHYIYSENTGQPIGRSASPRGRYAGKGFIEAISGSTPRGFIATPPPLFAPSREKERERQRCDRRSD